MTTLRFNGERTRPFTLKFPSGDRRHIEPEVSREVELPDEDATWLLTVTAEAGTWVSADAVAEPAAPAAGTTRANRVRQQAAAEDGKS